MVKASFKLSTNPNNKNHKIHIASNGEKLVSKQELFIYEQLLKESDLHVEYEAGFEGSDKVLFPDFTVKSLVTGQVFIWEHFGMTNSDHYLNQIPNKLVWYAENGAMPVDQGGNLIITYYNERTFQNDVANAISTILT